MKFVYRLNIRKGAYLTWFLISCFCAHDSIAQKKNSIDVAYGDEYFKNGDYFKADEYYRAAYLKQTNSAYITYHIAECNRHLFKYKRAEEFYGKTINNTASAANYPLAPYWFASMQKVNGNYKEARESFTGFIETFQPVTKEDQDILELAKISKEGCEFALEEMQKPLRDYNFHVLPTPLNSKYSDYSPAIFVNDTSLVITSSREETVGKETDQATGEAFSDNLRFVKQKSGQWTKTGSGDGFDEIVNTKYNDGAGVFNLDKSKFYYTQCSDDQGACAIFMTKFSLGKWVKPVKLNDSINEPGGWNAQPSLTHGGDTLFFVSKRNGGKGQHDIWMSVAAKGEDIWGAPVNLDSINSPGIDMAPSYLQAEKTLFFSTNGRKGFGALDIFMAKGVGFKEISNVGLPFNSAMDDFYFIVGDSLGYLSSNREGGIGSDDIYTFSFKSKTSQLALIKSDTLDSLVQSVSVKGKIVDEKSKLGVPDMENLLADEQGNIIKKSKTNKDGDFRYENLDVTKNYKVLINEDHASLTKKKNYKVANVKVEGSVIKPSKNLFENIYYDYDKSELRPEAMKVLDELADYLLKNPKIQVELRANTDAIGSNHYNVSLSRKRGDNAMDYLVKKGIDRSSLVVDAEGEGKPLATNKNEIGRQLNRRVEFYVLGDANFKSSGMVYILQPKNTLFSIAKENGITVEELMRFNGLDGEEIKAYSPIRIPRKANNPSISPNTTEVLKHSPSEKSENTTATEFDIYVVQPGNTMFSISKEHGMLIEELETLNGLTDSKVMVGQKLKVKKK